MSNTKRQNFMCMRIRESRRFRGRASRASRIACACALSLADKGSSAERAGKAGWTKLRKSKCQNGHVRMRQGGGVFMAKGRQVG
eukprot:1137002-Pelagomonas_calceolata.AAC.1